MSSKPGTFQKGNKMAVGSRGPTRPNILTQALISQLHEIDKNTSKEKIHRLVEELIKHALGYKVITVTKTKGKPDVVEEIEVPSELPAIREIFDRVEGKSVQAVGFDAPSGKVTLVFEPDDERV